MATEKDLKYLENLEEKMHSWNDVVFHDDKSSKVHDFIDDTYTKEEINKVLDIVKKYDDLVIYPQNGNFGFKPVYVVARIENIALGLPAHIEDKLYISHRQLPEKVDFKTLSKIWEDKKKSSLMAYAGISIKN